MGDFRDSQRTRNGGTSSWLPSLLHLENPNLSKSNSSLNALKFYSRFQLLYLNSSKIYVIMLTCIKSIVMLHCFTELGRWCGWGKQGSSVNIWKSVLFWLHQTSTNLVVKNNSHLKVNFSAKCVRCVLFVGWLIWSF